MWLQWLGWEWEVLLFGGVVQVVAGLRALHKGVVMLMIKEAAVQVVEERWVGVMGVAVTLVCVEVVQVVVELRQLCKVLVVLVMK